MRFLRSLMVVILAVGGLSGGSTSAWIPALEEASAASKYHVRVIYLQEMDPREATTLLRSQADCCRSLAVISDRNAIVVRDTADVVDRCETLLRERDAVLRVADPHEPVELPDGRSAPGGPGPPLATRVFRIAGDNMRTVVTVLRATYDVRELSEIAQDNTVSVRATQSVLDSSEALFRELELLDLPTAGTGAP